MTTINDLEKLIRSPEFANLENEIKKPNIFRALHLERMEIRHSNFIAYLLDPNETHGISNQFLSGLLKKIGIEIPNKIESTSNVDIRREWRNIDILVITHNEVIAIENKIDSMDHHNQLARYRKIIEEDFPKHKQHFIFLTPTGTSPNDVEAAGSYTNLSYFEVLKALQCITPENERTKIYIEDYKNIISSELLMDSKTNQLALEIYNKNKEVLDFIFENKPDPLKALQDSFEQVLKEQEFELGSKNKGFVRFTTKNLNTIPNDGTGWSNKEAFLFEIQINSKDVTLKAVISPGEASTRNSITNAVKSLPGKLYKEPKGNNWLVFYTEKLNIKPKEVLAAPAEEIKSKAQHCLADKMKDIKAIADCISNAFSRKQAQLP